MLNDSRAVVIWNASAGSAEQAEPVRAQLGEMSNVSLREPGGHDASVAETAAAVRAGAELIVAAGGDGTLRSVIEGMLQEDPRPPLGILPLGTGNDLARALEIPLAPRPALDVLSSGSITPLDTVRFTSSRGTQSCVNMLTGGNTGKYLRHMTADVKRLWGPLCYLRGVVDVIRDLEVFDIEVTCDGGDSESFETLNIFVANGRFSGGGMLVSPHARPDDGLLDVVIVRNGEPVEIAMLSSRYLFTQFLEHELIEYRRARTLTITSREPGQQMPLTADGDDAGETPLEVTVEPQSLRVVVPVDSALLT